MTVFLQCQWGQARLLVRPVLVTPDHVLWMLQFLIAVSFQANIQKIVSYPYKVNRLILNFPEWRFCLSHHANLKEFVNFLSLSNWGRILALQSLLQFVAKFLPYLYEKAFQTL